MKTLPVWRLPGYMTYCESLVLADLCRGTVYNRPLCADHHTTQTQREPDRPAAAMHHLLPATLAVLCCFSLVTGYDLFVDLTSGTTLQSCSSLSWATSLYGSGTCGKKGVLKLSFGAPGSANRKNKVLIDMWFNNPSGWVFNIGDSPTNNGYGGDGATTSRDAEIQGTSSTFRIYGNDQNSPAGGILLTRSNIITNRLSVIIADGLVIWNNWGSEFNYYLNTNLLYALNGQSDSEGGSPNYDIYFGINRSIGSGGRVGTGLCHAYVTWLS
ncbi:uncharacterized protein LOC124292007 [Haliotis rubra]|uniref:uncharacterized protein LOC124292007 n=1 Tax=Haliotis rubra TaxID=36100 RepID=UPI001EE52522|nr:uncharacterized protein LOC124292007 [Haliotis rubra]